MNSRKPLFDNRDRRIGLAAASVFVFIIFFYHFVGDTSFNDTGIFMGINFNYIAYLGSFVFSMIFGFAVYQLSGITVFGRYKETSLQLLYLAFFCGFVAWLYLAYRNETSMFKGLKLQGRFLREQIDSKPLWFGCSFIVTFIVLCLLQSKRRFEPERNVRSRKLFSLLIILLCSAFTFAPNIYLTSRTGGGGIFHADAYINSIINVAHYVPYDDAATSIYGHYAILYLPFVKLLGNNTLAIMLTISLFTAVMYASIAHIADYLTDNDAIFFITLSAVAGISTTFFGTGQYYQIYPHRILFPVLTISLLITDRRKSLSKRVRIAAAVIFGIMACLFNLETGMCCVIVIGVYAFFAECDGSYKRQLLLILSAMALMITSFFGALLIVDIYNLITGGAPNSIKQFIFPIGSEIYNMFDTLRTPLPGGTGSFLLQLYAFFVVAFCCMIILFSRMELGSAVKKREVRKDAVDGFALISLCLAVSGMGNLTYFMNRAIPTCLEISHIHFILCLCVICQVLGSRRIESESMKAESLFLKVAGSLACMLIIYFSIEGTIWIGRAIRYRSDTEWNITSYEQSMETVKDSIPEDTLGIGVGELYYSLGWTNMVYTIDYADNNIYGIRAMEDAISRTDRVLVFSEVLKNDEIPLLTKEYHQVDEIKLPEFELLLFERND